MSADRFNAYVERESFLHRLDPRAKLIWLPLGFALVMMFNHPAYVGGVFAVTLLLALSAGLPAKPLRRVMAANLFILVASVLIYPIYLRQGPVLFELLGIEYTRDALLYATAVGLRLMTMTTMSTVTIMTTSPSDTVLGLERLGLPNKAAMVMSLLVRFLPVLVVEGNTIVEAQKARALRLDQGNPIARIRKYTPIIIPLFTRSFLLARQLGTALDARGFGLLKRRTHLKTLAFGRADHAFIGAWAFVVIAGIVARFSGYGVIVRGLL